MIRPSLNRFTWRVTLAILILCVAGLSVASADAPASVTGLTNTTYAPNLVTWVWEDPDDACFTHVMVFINGFFSTNVSKGTETYTAVALTPEMSYTISTRTAGTGCGVNDTWVNSTAMTSPVPPCVPDSVTDLHNTTFLEDSITWAWTDPTDDCFDFVSVYLDGAFQEDVPAGIQMFEATGLAPDTDYTLSTRTWGVDGVPNDTWVNNTARTAPVPPCVPDSVTDLHNTTFLEDSITWAWTDPTDDCFDNVSVYLDGVFQEDVPAGVQMFEATGLAPDTDYTLSAMTNGIDGVSNDTWVNSTARTAPVPPCVPDSVTDLHNTTFLEDSITWAWTDPTDDCFDNVSVYLDGVFQDCVPAGVQMFEATGLAPDTDYTLSTRTKGVDGVSNDTWVNSTARTAPVPPCIPDSVTNLTNTTFLEDSIAWAWTEPTDDCFDHVMVYLNGVFKANVTKGTEMYNATGLMPDTNYTLSTRTVGSDGSVNMTWVNSTARTAPMPFCLPGSVTGLHNTTYLQNHIRWVWTDPTDDCFVNVSVYLNGVFQASVPKGTREFIASGLAPDTNYTLSTRTVGSDGVPNSTWVNSTAKTAPAGPKGSLYVYSIPSNATILIDGIPMGMTNNLISNIDSGLRTLTLTKPGYQTKTLLVNVPAGDVNVLAPITLQPGGPGAMNGTLWVYSSPSNATILIDGVNRGQTNNLVPNVTAGLRNLTLVKTGYQTKTLFVEVPAGELKVLAPISLTPV